MASKVYGHVIDRGGNVVGRVSDLRRGGGGTIGLNIDTRTIDRLGDVLRQAAKAEPAAVARALSRTATETTTKVARALVTQTGLPYGVVRKALNTISASPGNLVAKIVATGSYVPLAKFAARQTGRGVSAQPWNVRRVFKSTFVIRKFGGNVYARVGKGRFPLHKLYGPAIPVELPKDQSRAAFFASVPGILAKRLDHELGRLLG